MARILGQLPQTPSSTGTPRLLGKIGSAPDTSNVEKAQPNTWGQAAENVFNGITSSEKNVGNIIGQSAALQSKDYTDAQTSHQNVQDQIFKTEQQIKQDKAQGKDTSHLEFILDRVKQNEGLNNPTPAKIAPATTQSNVSALSSVAGIGLDALSAGTFGATKTAAMKTGELAAKATPTVISAVEQGVKSIPSEVKSILPEAKTLGEKALSLTKDELSAVDKSKLKYLTDKGFDMAKTEGGLIKTKMYKMTDQVKKLASEFSHVLTSKKPEVNLQNVQKELSKLQKQSKSAFDGISKETGNLVNLPFNRSQITKNLKTALSNISDSVYESMSKENKNAFSDKRIADFLSYVKDGTLKGLDDGLEAFRAANAKSDATISKATDATYQAVKKYIIDNLPKEKATLYKEANQAQAKLFDVAEILKGKLQASIGDLNRAGKFLKGAATVTGGIVGEKLLKQVPGLGFLP